MADQMIRSAKDLDHFFPKEVPVPKQVKILEKLFDEVQEIAKLPAGCDFIYEPSVLRPATEMRAASWSAPVLRVALTATEEVLYNVDFWVKEVYASHGSRFRMAPSGKYSIRATFGQESKTLPQRKDGTYNAKLLAECLVGHINMLLAIRETANRKASNAELIKRLAAGTNINTRYESTYEVSILPTANPGVVYVSVPTVALNEAQAVELITLLKKFGRIKETSK